MVMTQFPAVHSNFMILLSLDFRVFVDGFETSRIIVRLANLS